LWILDHWEKLVGTGAVISLLRAIPRLWRGMGSLLAAKVNLVRMESERDVREAYIKVLLAQVEEMKAIIEKRSKDLGA
jgi:hypothetical protein